MCFSTTSTFFNPSCLIVFFIKYVFFLFDSASVTLMLGRVMPIIMPGSPAPVPISKRVFVFVKYLRVVRLSLTSVSYTSSKDVLTKRLCVLLYSNARFMKCLFCLLGLLLVCLC